MRWYQSWNNTLMSPTTYDRGSFNYFFNSKDLLFRDKRLTVHSGWKLCPSANFFYKKYKKSLVFSGLYRYNMSKWKWGGIKVGIFPRCRRPVRKNKTGYWKVSAFFISFYRPRTAPLSLCSFLMQQDVNRTFFSRIVYLSPKSIPRAFGQLDLSSCFLIYWIY